MAIMLSNTSRSGISKTRRSVLLGTGALVSGCVASAALPGQRTASPEWGDDSFIMSDGARLPVRVWHTEGKPEFVVLALHGFNDSRDAWEIPAPDFVAAGMMMYAPDQRGFGEAPGRGLWPGGEALTEDASEMVGILRRRHPDTRIVLMGESMGGAVLMRLATLPNAPTVSGYVLVAPAVWGRVTMNAFERIGLWAGDALFPGLKLTGRGLEITPSDNVPMLRALSRDPLVIKATRIDTVKGLVDLMDLALASASRIGRLPMLLLYGQHDEIVPHAPTHLFIARLTSAQRAESRIALYEHGYHMLLRDLDARIVIGDVAAWIGDHRAALPSGADRRAKAGGSTQG